MRMAAPRLRSKHIECIRVYVYIFICVCIYAYAQLYIHIYHRQRFGALSSAPSLAVLGRGMPARRRWGEYGGATQERRGSRA